MRGCQVGQFGDQLRAVADAQLRLEPIFDGGQAQSLQPGDRRVKGRAFLQADVLQGRTAPQCERLAQQSEPPWILLVAGSGEEALESHGVDGVGLCPQPVAVRLPFDGAVRQCLAQAGHQSLQGVGRVGGRVFAPDPVDEGGLGNYVTWFEREGDQQRAQPGARHVGVGAVVRANLERSEYPDLHATDFAMRVKANRPRRNTTTLARDRSPAP